MSVEVVVDIKQRILVVDMKQRILIGRLTGAALLTACISAAFASCGHGEALRQLTKVHSVLDNRDVHQSVFSSDSRFLAGSHWANLYVYSLRDKRPPVILKLRESWANAMAFGGDSSVLAIANGTGRSIDIWNVDERKIVKTLTGHRTRVLHIAFSPDGRMLASIDDSQSIRLWDVARGAELASKSIQEEDATFGKVRFAASGKQVLLAGGAEAGQILILDVPALKQVSTIDGFTSKVADIAVVDGHVAAVCRGGDRLYLYHLTTGRLVGNWASGIGGLRSVAWNPVTNLLAIAGYNVNPANPFIPVGAAQVWQIDIGQSVTGKAIAAVDATGSLDHINISPNGELLAASGRRGNLGLWKLPALVQMKH